MIDFVEYKGVKLSTEGLREKVEELVEKWSNNPDWEYSKTLKENPSYKEEVLAVLTQRLIDDAFEKYKKQVDEEERNGE